MISIFGSVSSASLGGLLLLLCVVTNGDPNTDAVQVLCNTGTYTTGDPFGISLLYVLNELESVTPSSSGYEYSNISPFPNAFAYGYASCDASRSDASCAACLRSAVDMMRQKCGHAVGARAERCDCRIRYEQYPFSGIGDS